MALLIVVPRKHERVEHGLGPARLNRLLRTHLLIAVERFDLDPQINPLHYVAEHLLFSCRGRAFPQ